MSTVSSLLKQQREGGVVSRQGEGGRANWAAAVVAACGVLRVCLCRCTALVHKPFMCGQGRSAGQD